MTGTIKFELDFEVDNDWQDADETIQHIKNIVRDQLMQMDYKNKLGPGVSFDGLYEDWHDLTFKTSQDRYEDHLMNTNPKV
jgi:hypothetical protein